MGYLCNRNRKQRSRSEDSQEQPYTYVSDQEEPSRSLLQSDSALATRHQDGSSVYSMNTLANRSNSSFRSRVKSGSMRSRTAGSQITHSVVDDEGVWRSRSAESLTSVLDSYPPSAEVISLLSRNLLLAKITRPEIVSRLKLNCLVPFPDQ